MVVVQLNATEVVADLVDRYEAELLAYAARLVGADDAADVVQQAFVKAWSAIAEGHEEIDNPRAWLYRVVRNGALDQLRRARGGWNELDTELPAPGSTEHTFEGIERLGRVSFAVAGLPDRQRRALVMHALDGRSYSDVAVAMGTDVPVVSQLIARARARLRELAVAVSPPLVRAARCLGSLGGSAKLAVVAIAVGGGVA